MESRNGNNILLAVDRRGEFDLIVYNKTGPTSTKKQLASGIELA